MYVKYKEFTLCLCRIVIYFFKSFVGVGISSTINSQSITRQMIPFLFKYVIRIQQDTSCLPRPNIGLLLANSANQSLLAIALHISLWALRFVGGSKVVSCIFYL